MQQLVVPVRRQIPDQIAGDVSELQRVALGAQQRLHHGQVERGHLVQQPQTERAQPQSAARLLLARLGRRAVRQVLDGRGRFLVQHAVQHGDDVDQVGLLDGERQLAVVGPLAVKREETRGRVEQVQAVLQRLRCLAGLFERALDLVEEVADHSDQVEADQEAQCVRGSSQHALAHGWAVT